MARYTGPVCRLCRTEQTKLFLKGDRCKSDKCPINRKALPPGKAPKSRQAKQSDYAVQLREKQKLKRTYGLMETQFRNTFEKALRMSGKTGENLFGLLERRLDTVVYRMRFASSRAQARQLVLHGHIAVNGKRVDVPSFIVKPGDQVAVHADLQEARASSRKPCRNSAARASCPGSRSIPTTWPASSTRSRIARTSPTWPISASSSS